MVITVSCPSCAASFPVDTNKVPAGGVNARCSSCGQIFRVEKPVEAAPPPPAPEPEPEPVAFEPEPEPEPEPLPTFDAPLAADEGHERHVEAEADFSVGVDQPDAPESGSDWVFETEQEIDAGGLDIQPMETVESAVSEARDEAAFFGAPPVADVEEEVPSPVAPEPEPEPEPAAPVSGFTFGKRDPKDKARRLARVLVSDMIMYNPERHERALANGTLREDFEDEIAKSWKEYVEQVGEEMATENPFWTEALNDVLAKGEQVF